jgi:hypothetical protein
MIQGMVATRRWRKSSLSWTHSACKPGDLRPGPAHWVLLTVLTGLLHHLGLSGSELASGGLAGQGTHRCETSLPGLDDSHRGFAWRWEGMRGRSWGVVTRDHLKGGGCFRPWARIEACNLSAFLPSYMWPSIGSPPRTLSIARIAILSHLQLPSSAVSRLETLLYSSLADRSSGGISYRITALQVVELKTSLSVPIRHFLNLSSTNFASAISTHS